MPYAANLIVQVTLVWCSLQFYTIIPSSRNLMVSSDQSIRGEGE